jgi:ATP-dependent helicase/nuclease subunit A
LKNSTDDRTRASTDLTSNLAVMAGAGAGKTTVLVDRFVALAREPEVGPERILAITFTRKAATEMKERVIRRFEDSGEVLLRRATEASYISTIHGFAERILRERPFDARIDPAFSVITDYDRELWIQQALQTMYERPDLRGFAPRLKKEWEGGWQIFTLVREVARLLREGPKGARAEADAMGDDTKCVEVALGRIRTLKETASVEMLECMRRLEPMLARPVYKSFKAQYEQAQEYLAAVRACLKSKTIAAHTAGIWSAKSFTAAILEEHREPIKDLLGRIKGYAPRAMFDQWGDEEALERELLPLKRAIYSAAEAIGQNYAAHKRQIGALDFHDLQLRAAALLAENPAVRAEYAERFRHILLDEAQDTDELQYGIIESLRTPDNRLFLVGDPKQAIYEFRGADPEVFNAALEKMPADDRLQLTENFRSRPEIIGLVNRIGGSLLPKQFVTMNARADYAGQALVDPAVTAIYAEQLPRGEGEKGYEPISDARPREAAAVAEELVRLLRERPLVRDPEAREVSWIPLQPRHVAILFRTRTAIPYFERALAERGVPYVTAAGLGFYERAEVLDCVMMLRAIAQPLDDLALAAVLRSPFVGASDADLWRLRAPATTPSDEMRPIWHALRRYEPLAAFYNAFVALRARVRGGTASEALEDAIRTFGYEAAVAAHEDGPAMLANLGKARRLVRDMGSVSALEAYEELQRTRELMTNEALAPLVGTADDVVVLTTIHQAKGLEWPIVCIPNLQSPPRNYRQAFSARHGTLLCPALNADGKEVRPMSIASIIDELNVRSEGEERRLLYVALTRARERLILSGCVKLRGDDEQKSWGKAFNPLSFLQRGDGGTLTEPGDHDCGSYRTRVRLVSGPVLERTIYQGGEPLAATFTPTVSDIPEAALPPLAALPLSLKVTELLSYRRCPQVYRFSHVLEIDENLSHRAALRGEGKRKATPVELGTIVHALLERARFNAADLDDEIERLVASEDEDLRARLAQMLKAVLSGEIGDAVRGAKRVEREWPFAMRVGGVMIEGVIDLALQGQDGRWTVIDYKSNDFSRMGRFEYLTDYYAPQLELYAMALARAGVGEVAECALVFLAGPKVHRWAFEPARLGIDAWSEETVRQIAARDYATVAGPKCDLCGYRKRKVCDVGRTWTPSSAISTNRGALDASEAEGGR